MSHSNRARLFVTILLASCNGDEASVPNDTTTTEGGEEEGDVEEV